MLVKLTPGNKNGSWSIPIVSDENASDSYPNCIPRGSLDIRSVLFILPKETKKAQTAVILVPGILSAKK